MKKTKSISSLFGQVSLVVALLAAFVFSASNGLQMPEGQQKLVSQEQEQEQEQSDERPLAYIDYACNALIPVAAQLNLFHQPYFEAALPPVVNSPEKILTLPSMQGSRFFRILFRLIISPNAP